MILQSLRRPWSGFDDRRKSDAALAAVVVITGAFAAWGLWIGEVRWLKGWAGLAWLEGFNWSAFPISVVIMAVSSFVVAPRAGWRGRATFVGLGSILAVAAFAAARWAIFELFSEVMVGTLWQAPVAMVVLSWVIVAVGLSVLANWCLTSLRVWTAALVALGLMLVLPLSFATIEFFPALNGSTDELHTIKMGYPVFWTALIVPLALRIGLKRAGTRHRPSAIG
jgi:hypothetical protein